MLYIISFYSVYLASLTAEKSMPKTPITLTPPTVGQQSADKIPDFSSFFIGRQKINYKYTLVIIFFPLADSFWVLAIGRWSADDRRIIARHLSSANVWADCRPTIGRL